VRGAAADARKRTAGRPGPRAASFAPFLLGLALLALSACDRQRQPVIPRAAYTERTTHREAVEGRDTTWARLTYPDFVGARTPEALDSLRALVNALLLAPAGNRKAPAGSMAALMDGFISDWSEQRKATRSRAYWRLDRHVEVLAETLGVVSLAVTEIVDTGGAHPARTVRLIDVDANTGHTIRPAGLPHGDLRDSLEAKAP
jgi:hypothetical protein